MKFFEVLHSKSLSGLVGLRKYFQTCTSQAETLRDFCPIRPPQLLTLSSRDTQFPKNRRSFQASDVKTAPHSHILPPTTASYAPSHAMAKPYVPHDVLDETAKTSLVGLGSGFFIAAVQNALSRRNVGALSVFTRGAPIIGICGMDVQTPEERGTNWTADF